MTSVRTTRLGRPQRPSSLRGRLMLGPHRGKRCSGGRAHCHARAPRQATHSSSRACIAALLVSAGRCLLSSDNSRSLAARYVYSFVPQSLTREVLGREARRRGGDLGPRNRPFTRQVFFTSQTHVPSPMSPCVRCAGRNVRHLLSLTLECARPDGAPLLHSRVTLRKCATHPTPPGLCARTSQGCWDGLLSQVFLNLIHKPLGDP